LLLTDITYEDLKNQFVYGYTTKEIDEIFAKQGKDRDGKLFMEDFIKMILPSDYVIEEKEDNQWSILSTWLKIYYINA